MVVLMTLVPSRVVYLNSDGAIKFRVSMFGLGLTCAWGAIVHHGLNPDMSEGNPIDHDHDYDHDYDYDHDPCPNPRPSLNQGMRSSFFSPSFHGDVSLLLF